MTHYDDLVQATDVAIRASESYATSYDDPQEAIRAYEFAESLRADVFSRLAMAEQQRIANLLALATAVSPVRFPQAENPQAEALDQALEGLGFPRRDA